MHILASVLNSYVRKVGRPSLPGTNGPRCSYADPEIHVHTCEFGENGQAGTSLGERSESSLQAAMS